MFDDQSVHLAMTRIFAPVATAGDHPPAPPSVPEPAPAAPRRRWFMGKDGIAAAGFALAVTAAGIVMAPLLSTPTATTAPTATLPPPAMRSAAPIPASAAAIPAPAPIATPAPVPVAAMAESAPAAAPVPPPAAARPQQIVRTARPRTLHRHDGRPRTARYRRRAEAPRLYGAALRRALARDVIATRRLNQQTLRRLRAR